MSEVCFVYLVLWISIDAVLKYVFGLGTPRSQVVPQGSTTITPPPLRPAKNSAGSFNVASTLLIAVPVGIAVLCCFGCVAYCKIKTG